MSDNGNRMSKLSEVTVGIFRDAGFGVVGHDGYTFVRNPATHQIAVVGHGIQDQTQVRSVFRDAGLTTSSFAL